VENQRSRRWVIIGLIVYGIAALAILLLPVSYSGIINRIWSWLHAVLGVTFGSGWIEFAANIALFVPLGFLLTLLFRHPWYGTILSVVLSAGVEIAQIVIPDRQPTVRDVVSNSLGAAIGALLAWIIVLRRTRRLADRKRAASQETRGEPAQAQD
jgi:glycopeptide antibiotics resistance protein